MNPFPNNIRSRGNPDWLPGKGGNPSGRPKIPREVTEAARARTMQAIETLSEVCENKKAPPSARVQAAIALLDRAWGKPTQPIDANVNILDQLSEIGASALLAAIEAVESGTGDAESGVGPAH